ncbi:MAG: type I-E CRISPR-associated protein Cse2/CasB [Candidatus Sigynarchaeota archaeon]
MEETNMVGDGDAATTNVQSPVVTFVNRLQKLREQERWGDLAALRRAAGTFLGESAAAMQQFYRLLPLQVTKPWEEEIYYLVATLFDLNREEPPKPRGDWDMVNFGATMRECKARSEKAASRTTTDDKKGTGKKNESQKDESRESSIDKRFSALLESSIETGELAYRLRQLVRLAASKEIGVNWGTLLDDLLWWGHEAKRVQKRWARSYYGEQRPISAPDVFTDEPGGA